MTRYRQAIKIHDDNCTFSAIMKPHKRGGYVKATAYMKLREALEIITDAEIIFTENHTICLCKSIAKKALQNNKEIV
jgi:hypothetical protein